MMINVYGSSGFIGSRYCQITNKILKIPRDENCPSFDATQIVYFISTTDNYNVFTNPKLDIETNLLKFVDVLESWRKTSPSSTFNFISSWFVYGKQESLPVSETAVCSPTGFYSITKHAAEQLLISYSKTYKLNYKILRLANIIGPNDKNSSSKKNAITHMISNLIQKKEIFLYDNGEPVRDIMHVDDCVNAINFCINDKKLDNDIINISNSDPITIKKLIDYCSDKYQLEKKLIKYKPSPEFHSIVQTKNMWLDNKKLLSTGYKAKYTVFEAIDDAVKNLL